MSKRAYDYLIVGAGIFGSVFAYEAGRRGKRCLVMDKRPHVGGNLYCKEMAGIPVHVYGPHIFHCRDLRLWEYMKRFCGFFPYINSPLALSGGKIYHMPFNMDTFNAFWGCQRPDEARKKIESVRIPCPDGEARNLEEQALSIVGPEIYEALIKHYTEKQWGSSCKDLPASIIRRLPLRFTWDNNYFNDPYQGIPEEGYMPLFDAWLAQADLKLGTDYLDKREQWDDAADRIVYSGMIDAFYDYRFGPLRYRSLRFEHKTLDCLDFQGNAVVNYCDAEPAYTRLVEHKHFYCHSPEEAAARKNWSKTVVSYEYPQEWKPSEEAYYPVNDTENQDRYRLYQGLALQEPRHVFGGRLGSYAYYNMDQVLDKALKLAAEELGTVSI